MKIESLTPEELSAEIEAASKRGYSCALAILKNKEDARDAGQTAIEKTLKRIEVVVTGGLDGYVCAASRTSAYDIQRGRARRPADSLDALRGNGADPASKDPSADPQLTLDRSYEEERIRAAVETLPKIHRDVVNLRYWDELQPADIATKLDLNPATVRTRLHRAHQRLRRVLSEPV